jgi:5-methylcytosine-specific restriction endonuclease McrA
LAGTPARRLAPAVDWERESSRRQVAPLRRLYSTKAWYRLRWEVLLAASFTCAICGRVEGQTSLLVCDHIEPHRGDEALFWERSNLQCLCTACHDRNKQREVSAWRRGGG